MSSSTDITCREVIEFLLQYIEGELPADRRRAFDRHLQGCLSCVAYLDGYQRSIKLGRVAMQSTEQSARGQVPEGLLRAIRAARSATRYHP